MTQELILLIGIPGSGKSTLATKMCEKQAYFRVNKDDLRKMLGVTSFNSETERLVKETERAMVQFLLQKGVSVIVDNTHLSSDHRAHYKKCAQSMGAKYREILLEDSYDLQLCIHRVKLRNELSNSHKVPLSVVEDMHRKFVAMFGENPSKH